jgi:hypothetical protein
MTPTDMLTVLVTDGGLATKRIRRERKTGRLVVSGYGSAYFFRVIEHAVSDIATLARALDRLTSNPLAFCIRGAPLPGINRDRCRRLRYPDPKTGDAATFASADRYWLGVDLDKLARPVTIDPVSDPDGAIEYLIGSCRQNCTMELAGGNGRRARGYPAPKRRFRQGYGSGPSTPWATPN